LEATVDELRRERDEARERAIGAERRCNAAVTGRQEADTTAETVHATPWRGLL